MFEDNFQSYFGESNSNFFGDTSNDMIFGEGYGEQAVDGSQFFTENAGFSTDGGEFISEASEFDTMDSEFFTETNNSISGTRFNDMAETSSRFELDSRDKSRLNSLTKKDANYGEPSLSNSTHVTPDHIANRRRAHALRDSCSMPGGEHISTDQKLMRGVAALQADDDYSAARRHGKAIGDHDTNDKMYRVIGHKTAST